MPIDYTKRPSSPPPPEPPAGDVVPPPGGYPPPSAGDALPPPPGAAPPAAPPAAGGLVSLTKAAPTVSLTKHGGNHGVMRVNLNWDAKPPAKGLFRKNTQLDLDLGCLYEFSDGTKGVVQALGNSFVARSKRSGRDLIRLDGDDRSGTNTGGENLSIDLEGLEEIRRILIFALIYEGAANWADAKGVTTLMPVGAPPIEVLLDEPRDGARICAIALLTNDGGDLKIRREVNYVNGAQRALDSAYGWGMNWTAGRK